METLAKESGIIYESPILTWENEKRFLIPGVTYRGQTGRHILFKQMTPEMTQDNLAELYEMDKSKGNPVPTDAPLIWAISTRGYELRNENPHEAEKLRQFLRQGFRKYPNTLTRIAYAPSGADRIIHNYRTSDEYSTEAEVVGPNGFINKLPDTGVLEQLLGTQNVSQINEVSQWINGTDSYLWRLNSKPNNKDERVARFIAGGNWLDLNCGRDPHGGYPAFRVLKVD